MKKIFLAFAFVIFVGSVNSQVLEPVQWKYPKWYNEAGTQIYTTSAYLTGAASAIGDTISSEKFPLDFEELKFGFSLGVGDTMYANLHVQWGTGPISGTSFYSPGGIAMTAKSDSIISLGLRQEIVGQTCKLLIRRNPQMGSYTTTAGGYTANRDSTATYTFPGSLNPGSYTWVRLILIPHGAVNDVSNSTILNNGMVIIKRRYSSW